MRTLPIAIPHEALREFCDRRRIKRLALFGSVLRDDFTDSSDVDVLVEFAPDTQIGLFGFSAIENELSDLLGRKVDLNTSESLSRYIRNDVHSKAETVYVAP